MKGMGELVTDNRSDVFGILLVTYLKLNIGLKLYSIIYFKEKKPVGSVCGGE